MDFWALCSVVTLTRHGASTYIRVVLRMNLNIYQGYQGYHQGYHQRGYREAFQGISGKTMFALYNT